MDPALAHNRLRPELFLLEPGIAHLNHGSFGAVPLPVLEARRRAEERLEQSPERFYREEIFPALDGAREEVARFLGTDPAGLVLVRNVTEAVQVVLGSLDLRPGDEIVYTDHAYGWVKTAIARACRDHGARPRCVPLPENPQEPGVLTEVLEAALTGRTVLVVLDQITSASALWLPVEEVCAAIGARVPVLVDAAHAPGLLDAPVPDGAAFWTGNLHKWAFAPRTSAVLVVAPAFRKGIRPLVESAGGAEGFPRSFTYLGTLDPTPYLALPAALAFPGEHLGLSFSELRRRNTALLQAGLEYLGFPGEPQLPLISVPLGLAGGDEAAWALTGQLRREGIEAAVTAATGQLHLRLSVQAYNGPEDFELLRGALGKLL